jgi:hypothetical protein
MIDQCSLCHQTTWQTVYAVERLPLFQNKVFATRAEALHAPTAPVELVQCQVFGFIWNIWFDPTLMAYDASYHNEQHYSAAFQAHIANMVALLKEKGLQSKAIVEIGCGKGYFFDCLRQQGFVSLRGYDPAYEGDHPDIIKDYFSEHSQTHQAEVIVLRHVLEHVADPFQFLHTIARTNHETGDILIEVPDFAWIIQRQAFWDMYYEHCNYFTSVTLAALFEDAEVKNVFGRQYLYLFGKLNTLHAPRLFAANEERSVNPFRPAIEKYDRLLRTTRPVVLWGGASKGVTFLNVVDHKAESVRYVVDMNPHKHNTFIPGTGHQILPPDALRQFAQDAVLIIIANENYAEEIRHQALTLTPHAEFVIL